MISIPQNIDSVLFNSMSGEKVAEYMTLLQQTPDSSLDSLRLAWLYRDTVASCHSTGLWSLVAIIVLAIVFVMYVNEVW